MVDEAAFKVDVRRVVVLLSGELIAKSRPPVNEAALVYKPAERVVSPPSAKFALSPRDVSYRSGDGTRLSAWIID